MLSNTVYINVKGTDWFVLLLLWNGLSHGQRTRFGFGETELLGLSDFDWSFLGPTPTGHPGCKLVHKNIYLRAPSNGQKHKACVYSYCLLRCWMSFSVNHFPGCCFLTSTKGQSSFFPQRQHHRCDSIPLGSMWWDLWHQRRSSGTTKTAHTHSYTLSLLHFYMHHNY